MDEAIEYFSVFGGIDIKIDMNLPLVELIKKHILDEYTFLRNRVHDITLSDKMYHDILTAVATGDRRVNSTFKKANLHFDDGMDCVEELVEMNLLRLESPQAHLSEYDEEIQKKIIVSSPFLRFWFAFVSPIFKGIKEKDYTEFEDRFQNRKTEFFAYAFEELAHEFIKLSLDENLTKQFGRYWDKESQLDILAKTKDGKIIAGSCRYTNQKLKKGEYNKLKELCKNFGIYPDIYVIVTKKGFSNELKAMKDENFKLFTSRNFKVLID